MRERRKLFPALCANTAIVGLELTALALSKMGYNAFALIYRPGDPYADLAQAIAYIYDHAEELQVNPDGYSLWGGSAGARMAAVLGGGDAP